MHIQKLHQSQCIMEAIAEDLDVRNHLFHLQLFCIEPFKSLTDCICNQINTRLNLKWSTSILSGVDSHTIFNKANSHCQMKLYGWVDKINDPSYFLEIFSSTNHFLNLSRWTHSSVQSFLKASKNVKNKKQQDQCFKKVEQILIEEIPMIPLIYFSGTSLHHPHMEGILSNRFNQFDIRFASK